MDTKYMYYRTRFGSVGSDNEAAGREQAKKVAAGFRAKGWLARVHVPGDWIDPDIRWPKNWRPYRIGIYVIYKKR